MAIARMIQACRYSTVENTPWSVTENTAKQTPTTEDIKETKMLLRDFHITATIPEFMTLAQLLRWRGSMIDKALSH